jgi:hypothetical protein
MSAASGGRQPGAAALLLPAISLEEVNAPGRWTCPVTGDARCVPMAVAVRPFVLTRCLQDLEAVRRHSEAAQRARLRLRRAEMALTSASELRPLLDACAITQRALHAARCPCARLPGLQEHEASLRLAASGQALLGPAADAVRAAVQAEWSTEAALTRLTGQHGCCGQYNSALDAVQQLLEGLDGVRVADIRVDRGCAQTACEACAARVAERDLAAPAWPISRAALALAVLREPALAARWRYSPLQALEAQLTEPAVAEALWGLTAENAALCGAGYAAGCVVRLVEAGDAPAPEFIVLRVPSATVTSASGEVRAGLESAMPGDEEVARLLTAAGVSAADVPAARAAA